MILSSDNEFEVKDDITYRVVNLEGRICDCNEWAIFGIPCKHLMAMFTAKRRDSKEFVDPYLTKAAFIKTYK